MGNLLCVLRDAVRRATFEVHGESNSSAVVRTWYLNKDHREVGLNTKSLKVDQHDLARLVETLTPQLQRYMHDDTGRIGNGFYLTLGGSLDDVYLTVEEFAKMLVVGAAKLEPQRVADLTTGWVNGEPLRTREHVLLEGVEIDLPLAHGGISLGKRTVSSPHPQVSWMPPQQEEQVVGTAEIAVAPAVYKPSRRAWTDIEEDPWKQPDLEAWKHEHKDFRASWERRCEAMALASGGFVGWRQVWREWEDLNAFQWARHYSSRSKGDFRRASKRQVFSQDLLAEAVAIERKRHEPSARNLELAIRRWARSHLGEQEDQLIELRIALEALYAEGGRGIARAIAGRGAWHLGRNFAQRREYHDVLRKVYQDASNVIHANKARHVDQDKSLLDRGRELCRKAILTIMDCGTPKWSDLVLGRDTDKPA